MRHWRKFVAAPACVLCLVVHVITRDISRFFGRLNDRVLDWAVKP